MKELLVTDGEISVFKVKVDDAIEWCETKLNELLGYKYDIRLAPKISTNCLNYNVDETTMNDEQWEIFSERFNTNIGYSDNNFIELLNKVYGEADYHYYVTELNSFYIIRDKKEEN